MVFFFYALDKYIKLFHKMYDWDDEENIMETIQTNNPQVELIHVAKPREFDQVLANRKSDLARGISVYGIFEAPWCPDCLMAYPVINNVLDNLQTKVILLDMDVDPNEYLGNYNYLYRTHPKINLVGIPQIVKWKLENDEIVIDKVLTVREVSKPKKCNRFFQ